MPTFTTSTSRRWCNWARRPISTPPSSTLSTLSRSSTSLSAASWHRYRNSSISWPARIARVAPRTTGDSRPPTCVTGLVDFEYTLLLSHCCEDILGSGHLLQGHVSIAEFYPCSLLLLLRAFFQPNIHSFLFVGHAFKWKTFFRLSFIVNFEFLTHLFLMLLDDAILFKLLKNFIFTRYILYIRVFVHFEISKKFCLHSVISLILKLPFTRLILRYICTAF